jgi:hypothetical protein
MGYTSTGMANTLEPAQKKPFMKIKYKELDIFRSFTPGLETNGEIH